VRIYGTAEFVERWGQFGPGWNLRIVPAVSWSANLDGESYHSNVTVRRSAPAGGAQGPRSLDRPAHGYVSTLT